MQIQAKPRKLNPLIELQQTKSHFHLHDYAGSCAVVCVFYDLCFEFFCAEHAYLIPL